MTAVSPRRVLIERTWILVSVLYGVFRAYLVWEFLGDYRVNAFVFLIIELVASALYGLWSGRMVGAIIDGDRALVWRMAPRAALSFFAPDAYVLASAGRLPGPVLEVVLSVVAVSTVLTGIGLWVKVRNARRSA